MFLMIAITKKSEPLIYDKVKDCKYCSDRAGFDIFLTYNVFTLFFIPIFKWNYQYIVKTSCCHKTFILDKTIGDMIRTGDDVDIEWSDLQEVCYERNRV